jgi:crotonobetainyl-CoA:carnitine CoA-transferase CaiB-like acyl-CoA transferase
VLQRHDLLDRPEHRGTRDRAAHVEQLTIELQDLLVTRPTAHWVAALDGAGMPGWPVLTYSEALAQAQVAARDMVVEIEHPVIGPMHALGLPAKLSETPASVGLAAPLLGQHSREVLRSAGRTDAEIDAWIACGTVQECVVPETTPACVKR